MPKLPWNNSWFQLALSTALFSAGVLVWDFQGIANSPKPASQYNPSPSYTPPQPNPVPMPAPQPAPAAPASFPTDGTEWHNSLGMDFVPAGASGILFCATDTRVQDFRQFVQATGREMTAGVLSLDQNGWRQAGHSWSDPGFPQSDTCPVVAVSWDDAQQFCNWLTEADRKANLIASNQYYRLPTDAEWTTAAGTYAYPWGDAWPPAETAGNYLRQGDGIPNRSTLTGTDGYAYTSPVGSFPSNGFGLFDMGGNVWQWTQDWYRRDMTPERIRSVVHSLGDDGGGQKYKAARGGSFCDSYQLALLTASHDRPLPTLRQTNYGFRCVLVVTP
jgi:hypothetical protein